MAADNEQARHDALGDIIRARAIAAGCYYPPTGSFWRDSPAMQYERAARLGLYRSRNYPAFPDTFGMTVEEFDAARILIYPTR